MVFRFRRTAQELAIAATHMPDLLLRRRLTDGHMHQVHMQDLALLLRDAADKQSIPSTWVVGEVVPTVSDVVVVQIGEPRQAFAAYLKLARSPSAAEGLLAQERMLSRLHEISALREWARLLPRVIAHGEYLGNPYSIEAALSGVPISSLVGRKSWEPALRGAFGEICALHSTTGTLRVVDDDLFAKWVDHPLHVMASLTTSSSRNRHFEKIDVLRLRLQRALLGRDLWVSHTHGDFSPNNVLADMASGRTTGIVDWDRSHMDRPAFLDVGQFVIGAEYMARKTHLGAVVRRLCDDDEAGGSGLALLDDFWSLHPGDRLSNSVVALMTLLHHVQSNVDKAPRYASHRLWVHRTVESVLDSLEA